jgi:hypothetical protein
MEATQQTGQLSNKKIALYLLDEFLDATVAVFFLTMFGGIAMATGWYTALGLANIPNEPYLLVFMGTWFVPSVVVVVVGRLIRLAMKGIPELGIKGLF